MALTLTHQEGKVNLRLKIVQPWREWGSLRETPALHLPKHLRKWVS